MERLKIETDRGLLPAAVRGLAKCKGITYEEAHQDMSMWAKANPPPKELYQKGRATARDAHETWKKVTKRFSFHTPDDFMEPNF